MQPLIITSDKTSWSLRPMLYLIDKYWLHHPPFLISGFTPLTDLPLWAVFQSLGRFEDYPVNRWTDAVIETLNRIEDDYILFMMDDYWLNRRVDHDAVMMLSGYLAADKRIARLDLSGDRVGSERCSEHDHANGIDLIRSGPMIPYHFSFQAGLWRKKYLLDCLRPNESPWDAEIVGNYRLSDLGYLVLGTKQPPLRYTIAVQHGNLAIDGGYQGRDYTVSLEDILHIIGQNWIPAEMIPQEVLENA